MLHRCLALSFCLERNPILAAFFFPLPFFPTRLRRSRFACWRASFIWELRPDDGLVRVSDHLRGIFSAGGGWNIPLMHDTDVPSSQSGGEATSTCVLHKLVSLWRAPREKVLSPDGTF